MVRHIVVRAAWDEEASVWYVDHSDLFGLATEADTLEALRAKLPNIVDDLLLDTPDRPERVELDLIAHSHDGFRLAA